MAPESRIHKLYSLLLVDPRDVILDVLLVESLGIRDSWGSTVATTVLPVLSSILVPLRFFFFKLELVPSVWVSIELKASVLCVFGISTMGAL